MPPPNCVQLVPSHFAAESTGTPPMVVNRPNAWSLGPEPSSKTVIEVGTSLKPGPISVQLVPSRRRTPHAPEPPLDMVPAAYKRGPAPSSKTHVVPITKLGSQP